MLVGSADFLSSPRDDRPAAVESLHEGGETGPDPSCGRPALLPRERVVLDLVALGFANHEIAARLGLSQATVKRHVSRGYRKIGVTTRAEAIVWGHSVRGESPVPSPAVRVRRAGARRDDGSPRPSAIPPLLTTAALARALEQDLAERTWANPRDARPAETPWPTHDDPVLLFLVHQAVAAIAAGADAADSIRGLAVRAWFEGGVQAYDQGQRDARRPRST
ncbi:helix-turn-helix transcriptional regulator [Nocardioides sp. 1609]|uniref:helix-turn-helix domain-containing protein n=1 Tax=Nocardioides sp. 1609 TaxID=2508327 RepID=UPI00106F84D9|nr:helix-turn-helix transcriptional regulator [Nocardioides sp. 1609]